MKWFTALFFALSISAQPAYANAPCVFDSNTLSFQGDPASQAACLLRPVAQSAHIGKTPIKLPDALLRVGQKTGLNAERLREYLALNQIHEDDIGGSLDKPVSQAKPGKKGSYPARYFVIHDTSTPNYRQKQFPHDINTIQWEGNKLDRWKKGNESKAHVFVNRLGDSVTAVPFERGWRATRFELKYAERHRGAPATAARGLFLHIELVQPRRSARPTDKDDAISPDPGFTTAQYRRLALVYAAASVRAGVWLVPAYHAVMDAAYKGAHDDPQKFDLDQWAQALEELIKELKA